jgi:hypothetical protein
MNPGAGEVNERAEQGARLAIVQLSRKIPEQTLFENQKPCYCRRSRQIFRGRRRAAGNAGGEGEDFGRIWRNLLKKRDSRKRKVWIFLPSAWIFLPCPWISLPPIWKSFPSGASLRQPLAI